MGAHDGLFRVVFSDPENAAAEIRGALPAELAARIDWGSLERQPGSFVDEELAQRHADLLFSARIEDREALLYLLFEHQSEPDPWMPLRIATYVTRIWESFRRSGRASARLPVVLPIVLHHGASGWTSARSIAELLDAPPDVVSLAGGHLLSIRIVVDDLAGVSPADLAARAAPAVVRLALAFLRDARTLRAGELLRRWGTVFAEVARSRPAALYAILRYLVEVQPIDDREEIVTAIRLHAGAEAEEAAVNLFDKLRAEGRREGEARGRAEGEARGRAETLLKQLRLRFGALSEEHVARVRAASIDELDRWAERILAAGSIDDALG